MCLRRLQCHWRYRKRGLSGTVGVAEPKEEASSTPFVRYRRNVGRTRGYFYSALFGAQMDNRDLRTLRVWRATLSA